MSWTCMQVEERLSDHLDGLLSPTEEREFAAHSSGCARCNALLAQVTHVVGQLHTLDAEEAPPQLVNRILDQTTGPRRAKRTWLAWIPLLWQPRFAMGTVTVLVTFIIIFHAATVNKPNSGLAALNPVTLVRSADRQAHLAFARGVKFVNDLRVVYEIQSRLQPAASPAPPPGQQPPASAPASGPKSQRDPAHGLNAGPQFALLEFCCGASRPRSIP